MSMAESDLFRDLPQRDEYSSNHPGTARELRSAQTITVTSLLGDGGYTNKANEIRPTMTSNSVYDEFIQTEINQNDMSMSSASQRKKVKARAKKRVKATDMTVTEQSIIEGDEMDFDDPE